MSGPAEPPPGTTVPPPSPPQAIEEPTGSGGEKRPSAGTDSSDEEQHAKPAAVKKPLRFFALIGALAFAGLLTALEGTITSVALPTIIESLGGSRRYIWVVNVYFLATTVFQPLYGQLANIFGRRYPTLVAMAMFCMGSGICGGANNIETLIAGRAIQGTGASGINVLAEIIICDLVPLKDRGNYVAVIFTFVSVGTALGPLFGGLIVQHASWRWVFYLNLPIGGTALILMIVLLQLQYRRDGTVMASLKRIDWIGNVVLILSLVSLLTALSWAGTKYPWSSFRVIVPLVVGSVGCGGFLGYEGSKYCLQPTMPLHLFGNRTSLTAYILTFVHSMVTVWTVYFLPLYFQGVLASSPARSGVQLLPTILFVIPFTVVAGRVMSRFGQFRIIHYIGFAVMTLGFGLFSRFDETTSTAEWVIFQAIEAAGAGLVIPSLLPAVQAELTDSDNALSTSTWAFVRSFGMIWGATVPASVFNNMFDRFCHRISDAAVAETLANGSAYQHATEAFLDTLADGAVRSQVVGVFGDSLQVIWYFALAFAGLGFLFVSVEKEVPLRADLETEFGMTEKSGQRGPD